MSYLLRSKETRRKRNLTLFGIPILFLAIITVLHFKNPNFLGSTMHRVGTPLFLIRNGAVNYTGKFFSYFHSKSALSKENNELKKSLQDLEASLLQFNAIVRENEDLKTELGRGNPKEKILAYVLQGPGFSPYDTFIVDAGLEEGVKEGDKVTLGGNIAFGSVKEVFVHTSKVRAYSSSGEELFVEIPSNHLMVKAFGRGGGNFEIKLPKDIEIQKGTLLSLPGIDSEIVGIVESIESDAAQSQNNVFFRGSFNIHQIEKVYIKRQ